MESISFVSAGRMVRIRDDERKTFVCRVELSLPDAFGTDILWFTDLEVSNFKKLESGYEDLAVGSCIPATIDGKTGIVTKILVWQRKVRDVDVTTKTSGTKKIQYVLPYTGKDCEWVEHVAFINDKIYAPAKVKGADGTAKERQKHGKTK